MAWRSSNPSGEIDKIKSLGVPVYYAEPRHLQDIAVDIERLGVLAGTESEAMHAAQSFRNGIAELRRSYSGKPTVSVFYEVWPSPRILEGAKLLCSQIDGARNK